AARSKSRILLRQSRRTLLCCGELEMRLDLLGQLGVDRAAAPECGEARQGCTETHRSALRRRLPRDRVHRAHESRPIRFLRGELPAPGCCELIVARAAVVGRRTPRCLDPMLGEQALERRVERPALDLELAIRRLLDERRDSVPVLWSPAEDP